MQVKVYNQAGEDTGKKVLLPKEIFCVKVNDDLLHQVITAQQANQRQGTAHTKDRSERRGGGRKPWRQKGTGRARQGSRRSPLWRKGGVVFGPRKERNYKKVIPKKMRRKALLMALSSKARDKELKVIDELRVQGPKTKVIYAMLEGLACQAASALIVGLNNSKNIVLSARNLPRVDVARAQDLNALDVLQHKYLILIKPAIKKIKETFGKAD